MKKRILGIVLVLSLVLGLVPGALAAQTQAGLSNFRKTYTYTPGQFRDVSETEWYSANVKASIELGLVTGRNNGFAPNENMQVVEAIALAARIHSIYHTGSANFVQGSPWYQVYVDYAVENGIIGAGEYTALSAPATRAQFFKIFAKSVPESALQAINNIPAGSVHDLPASADHADAAYLLYNAGILTGKDSYGTFAADLPITRIEAATLATRVADPSLRKTFTLKVYDPEPPTKLTICDKKVSWSRVETRLAVGQSTILYAELAPSNAHSGITWTSSNPAVATVSEYGAVTAHKQGTATITAVTYNGVKDTFVIKVPNGAAQLQYALTADGKGYEITGCDADAFTVHVPATYNGLPVVGVRGGAFMECQNLRSITADKGGTLYAEGGVLFTDTPEKTLVAFPPAYDAQDHYYVPAGTVAVAPYAFAGSNTLGYLTLPEGVTTLGDCAFAGVRAANLNLLVYVPNSLTEIGDHLMQDQIANVAFFGESRSIPMALYAKENEIPFGVLEMWEPAEQTVEVSLPGGSVHDMGLIPVEDESAVVKVPAQEHRHISWYDDGDVAYRYDLSSYEAATDHEVRLMLEGQWSEILPDPNGDTLADFAPQTGLYGAGQTGGEATLRAYDIYGNLIATQQVGGNFAFRFPGAASLGVEGGTNTRMTIMPVEPIYISSGGSWPIQPEQCYELSDGNISQYLVVQIPHASVSFNFPAQLNVLTYRCEDCTGAFGGNESYGSSYQIIYISTHDASRIDQMDQTSLIIEGMDVLVDNEELLCMVSSAYGVDAAYGQEVYEALSTVKQTMAGDYFPATHKVHKINVVADGSYPSAFLDTVYLDESVVNGDILTLTHELVHAVDHSVESTTEVAPSAWLEGRAEYISRKVCDRLGYTDYWKRSDTFDWSYLSQADKDDFFRYFYFSTNRYTAYDVGYYFLRYLNDTYGEDVSGKIMANLDALTEWDDTQHSEANSVLFKQCVEAATEVGVFQNFVRDVIDK